MALLNVGVRQALAYLVLLGVVYRLATWARRRRAGVKYPPGPAGLPLLGNVSLPKEPAAVAYRDWGIEYGSDVLRLNVIGMNLIVLNTMEAAVDLLDKRSSIYSDRPTAGLTMLRDLCGMAWMFVFMPYGPEWRDGRKAFQREFHPHGVTRYRPVETQHTHALLRRLATSPDKIFDHIHHYAGGQIMEMTYGVEIKEENDPWIKLAEDVVMTLRACIQPGAFLVDLIPALKYVPEWMPGAGFKTKARLWKMSANALLHKPYDHVKQSLAKDGGTARDCVVKSFIENSVHGAQDREYMEGVAKAVSATIYIGGSDTIATCLSWFVLAMVLNPKIRREAQKSIDEVCQGRLPDFSDYDSLPYVHAVAREVLRWNPVTPLNPPHRLMEDDVYKGYLIPKGSVVFANTWAIMHDPEMYPSPDAFSPARFLTTTRDALDPAVRDPSEVVFGFGRRICPGQHMAYEALWITVACILAVFDIETVKGKRGEPVMPEVEVDYGFSAHPKPFKCSVKPRSEAHQALIMGAQGVQ